MTVVRFGRFSCFLAAPSVFLCFVAQVVLLRSILGFQSNANMGNPKQWKTTTDDDDVAEKRECFSKGWIVMTRARLGLCRKSTGLECGEQR